MGSLFVCFFFFQEVAIGFRHMFLFIYLFIYFIDRSEILGIKDKFFSFLFFSFFF